MMLRQAFISALLLLSFARSAGAQDLEVAPQPSGRVVEVGEIVRIESTEAQPSGTAEVYWDWSFGNIGSEYLLLFFDQIEGGDGNDFSLHVLGRTGEYIEEIDGSAFVGGEGNRFTHLVHGGYARLQLRGSERPSGLRFRLAQVGYEKEPGAVSSIVSPDEREEIAEVEGSLAEKARAVAHLVYGDGGRTYVCTGFMISDDMMLTNEHCINTMEKCSRAVAVFGYELGKDGMLSRGERFRCRDVLRTSYAYDAALLSLDRSPGSIYGVLTLSDRLPQPNEPLVVVGHPAGEPKQVSRKDCMVGGVPVNGRANNADFQHRCDTLGGSSGSPVLASEETVIGLHHFGFGSAPAIRSWNQAVLMREVIRELDLAE